MASKIRLTMLASVILCFIAPKFEAMQSGCQILAQNRKLAFWSRGSRNQNIVVSRPCVGRDDFPCKRAQATARAIARHSVAYFFGSSQAIAYGWLFACFWRLAYLHDKIAGDPFLAALRSRQELRALAKRAERRVGCRVPQSVMPRGACVPARGGGREPCGPLWSPCGNGSHGGACVPVCWVDMCVSCLNSHYIRKDGVYRRLALECQTFILSLLKEKILRILSAVLLTPCAGKEIRCAADPQAATAGSGL